jgi:hypothetical protein
MEDAIAVEVVLPFELLCRRRRGEHHGQGGDDA